MQFAYRPQRIDPTGSGSFRLTVIGITPSLRRSRDGVSARRTAMRRRRWIHDLKDGTWVLISMRGGSGGVVDLPLRPLSAAPSFCSRQCRFGRLPQIGKFPIMAYSYNADIAETEEAESL